MQLPVTNPAHTAVCGTQPVTRPMLNLSQLSRRTEIRAWQKQLFTKHVLVQKHLAPGAPGVLFPNRFHAFLGRVRLGKPRQRQFRLIERLQGRTSGFTNFCQCSAVPFYAAVNFLHDLRARSAAPVRNQTGAAHFLSPRTAMLTGLPAIRCNTVPAHSTARHICRRPVQAAPHGRHAAQCSPRETPECHRRSGRRPAGG